MHTLLPQNSKHEARNPKQIPMTQIPIPQTSKAQKSCLEFLIFELSCLFRISVFGFRVLHHALGSDAEQRSDQ